MVPAQALIFDMDGLLLDTERLYVEATQAVVGPFGHTVDLDQYADWIGRDVTPAEFVATYPCPLAPDEFMARLRHAFCELCETALVLLPGVTEFLDGAAAPYPKAIASSTRRATIESHLGQLGLRERFAGIASGKEVPRGKPAPDVFLEAARQLGVPPTACVVFEDSPHGVAGAKAAGMRAVAVPSVYTGRLPFVGADLTVPRLDAVAADWLAGVQVSSSAS